MRENDHVTEDVTLMEAERSCQRSQSNGGRIVVREVAT